MIYRLPVFARYRWFQIGEDDRAVKSAPRALSMVTWPRLSDHLKCANFHSACPGPTNLCRFDAIAGMSAPVGTCRRQHAKINLVF